MSDLQSIKPDELGVIAALLGVAPARSISLEELNVLGNFLVAVGSIMLTVAAQAQLIKVKEDASKKSAKEEPDTTVQEQIQELREQLQQLIDHGCGQAK